MVTDWKNLRFGDRNFRESCPPSYLDCLNCLGIVAWYASCPRVWPCPRCVGDRSARSSRGTVTYDDLANGRRRQHLAIGCGVGRPSRRRDLASAALALCTNDQDARCVPAAVLCWVLFNRKRPLYWPGLVRPCGRLRPDASARFRALAIMAVRCTCSANWFGAYGTVKERRLGWALLVEKFPIA